MSQEKRKIEAKKRPIKAIYPYMCPFCEEIAYPSTEAKKRPSRLPDSTITIFTCASGHEFYVCERVVTNQQWAEKQYLSERRKKLSKNWKRQLREHNYGVDDMPD